MESEALSRDDDIEAWMEEQVEVAEEVAENCQTSYEEIFDENIDKEELEAAVKTYTEALIHVDDMHDLMHDRGLYDLAERMTDSFESLLGVQSEYKTEAEEILGYSPGKLFAEYHRE